MVNYLSEKTNGVTNNGTTFVDNMQSCKMSVNANIVNTLLKTFIDKLGSSYMNPFKESFKYR